MRLPECPVAPYRTTFITILHGERRHSINQPLTSNKLTKQQMSPNPSGILYQGGKPLILNFGPLFVMIYAGGG
jgi:hypothetical protein